MRGYPPCHELLRCASGGRFFHLLLLLQLLRLRHLLLLLRLWAPALLHAVGQRGQEHVGQRVAPHDKAAEPAACVGDELPFRTGAVSCCHVKKSNNLLSDCKRLPAKP